MNDVKIINYIWTKGGILKAKQCIYNSFWTEN